jgi:hypothetical protein
LCSSPGTVAFGVNSGDLGTAATCDEVMGTSGHIVCGNFVAPRTMTVNGTTSVNCAASANMMLPATHNGGWCFQASAGDYSYAYFATY